MKYRLIILFLTLLLSFTAQAEPVDVADESQVAIGQYAWFMKEGETRLELDEVVRAYAAGKFSASKNAVMRFSIGSKPLWVRFDVANYGHTSAPRRISIETSWLDWIDVYFLQGSRRLERNTLGDALPFTERPVDNRFFVLDYLFEPGVTAVYMRVETSDPLVLPVYLTTREAMHAKELTESYSYGIIYGVILALLLYNLVLYFGIKSSRYLYYAIYLSCFLIANISYTGHGYKWLWPELPSLQLWGNPILMMAYAISGLLFATRFLDTKILLPRLHRLTIAGCWGFAIALGLAILIQNQTLALLIAFSFVVLFTCAMILLGALSLYAGNQSAKYFLYASLVAALSATVTALAVWGLIPYKTYTYRAVEIGMMIEAIMLALALAEQFRLIRDEKIHAEQMARIDSLTGLNNRRAFSELVDPLWKTGIRNKHEMSVVLLDIDIFKSINDTYGHSQGDKVLIYTAKALTQSARGGDILARWGGEEFILFMSETNLADAVAAAERIRESIAAIRVEMSGKTVSLTASFGVASYCKESNEFNSLDKLISTTDKYLYRAKGLGRNRVYSPLPE